MSSRRRIEIQEREVYLELLDLSVCVRIGTSILQLDRRRPRGQLARQVGGLVRDCRLNDRPCWTERSNKKRRHSSLSLP